MAARHMRKERDIIEYAVYIHLPANENSRFWERASITTSAELALEQAEMLFSSKKYTRVEVMRKFFCRKRQKQVSEKIRVFDISKPAGIFSRLFSKIHFFGK